MLPIHASRFVEIFLRSRTLGHESSIIPLFHSLNSAAFQSIKEIIPHFLLRPLMISKFTEKQTLYLSVWCHMSALFLCSLLPTSTAQDFLGDGTHRVIPGSGPLHYVSLSGHGRHMGLPLLEADRECEKAASLWQEITGGNFLRMRKRSSCWRPAAYTIGMFTLSAQQRDGGY